MHERLLQFIWQFQYFNKHQLATDEAEPLQVIHPGTFNTNQGPDFLNATIRIGNTTWAGHVELHIKASDWIRHQHTHDPNYNNVILHVVWVNDHSIRTVSTLSLKERIPKILLERYQQLVQAAFKQSCAVFLPGLTELGWISWKERLVAERLQRKADHVLQLLQETHQHWEEVLWWMIAANFGIKVNSEVFQAMARSLPVSILGRHKNQVIQLEALILGQANLLNGSYAEDYPQLLQKEYRFLKKKYDLKPHNILPHFLRMRPANFPTVRAAQLAMLVNRSTQLFSKIKEMQLVTDVKDLLDVTANDYWHYHYSFDELTDYKPKHLGEQMAGNIIINTIVPVMFAYGSFTKQDAYQEKAIQWLQQLPAENNTITRQWVTAEISNRSAFDSQSLIELTNHYCTRQRCLECAVGNKILQAT